MRWAALLLAITMACGGEAQDENATQDRTFMLAAVADDEALPALEEADRVLSQDLPVRAGSLLESGAIPALLRMKERAEALSPSSEPGRREKRELIQLLETRIDATRAYRRILARGLVEDFDFVQASAAMREADSEYYRFLERVQSPEQEGEESGTGDDSNQGESGQTQPGPGGFGQDPSGSREPPP